MVSCPEPVEDAGEDLLDLILGGPGLDIPGRDLLGRPQLAREVRAGWSGRGATLAVRVSAAEGSGGVGTGSGSAGAAWAGSGGVGALGSAPAGTPSWAPGRSAPLPRAQGSGPPGRSAPSPPAARRSVPACSQRGGRGGLRDRGGLGGGCRGGALAGLDGLLAPAGPASEEPGEEPPSRGLAVSGVRSAASGWAAVGSGTSARSASGTEAASSAGGSGVSAMGLVAGGSRRLGRGPGHEEGLRRSGRGGPGPGLR